MLEAIASRLGLKISLSDAAVRRVKWLEPGFLSIFVLDCVARQGDRGWERMRHKNCLANSWKEPILAEICS